MKKEKRCKTCQKLDIGQYLCDTCGKDLLKKYQGIPFTLECGYGSGLDGEEYDFCGFTCLLQFITAELRKTQPKETRFEYGKEDDNVES